MGTRMGKGTAVQTGTSRKQFMLLDGSPILIHTVRKFAASDRVSEIVVAVRAEDKEWVSELLAGEFPPARVRVVAGGNSRQESVENALATLGAGQELVAVHDAVRPFIDLETIHAVFDEAAECGAAIVGVPAVDTVKQVTRGTTHVKIRATLPREKLVMAQTPQVFETQLLKQAFAEAEGDELNASDEAGLVERLGLNVFVVQGSERNIKITKPSDMDLARFYLHSEQKTA
jgi:2-C-methyl-D-erythritol 4-phosphate cytidylyltransferase